MRLMIVIPGMNAGGAEHNAANIAAEAAGRGHKVMIFSFVGNSSFYPLPEQVLYQSADCKLNRRSKTAFVLSMGIKLPYVRGRLRSCLDTFQPDVVFSLLPAADILVYSLLRDLRFSGCRWVISERNDPGYRTLFLRQCLRVIYQKADRTIFQSQRAAEAYPKIGANRKRVLQNLISRAALEQEAIEETVPLKCINAGKLYPQKNQALLIRCFSQALRDTGIDARLIIYGSGPLGEELQKLIETEKMKERITIEAPNPQWLSKNRDAACFLLSSDFEGQSNALCEAILCGLPVVTTDTGRGTARRFTGNGGIVVPPGDREQFTDAIKTILTDRGLRDKFRKENAANRKKRFKENLQTADAWIEALFLKKPDTEISY